MLGRWDTFAYLPRHPPGTYCNFFLSMLLSIDRGHSADHAHAARCVPPRYLGVDDRCGPPRAVSRPPVAAGAQPSWWAAAAPVQTGGAWRRRSAPPLAMPSPGGDGGGHGRDAVAGFRLSSLPRGGAGGRGGTGDGGMRSNGRVAVRRCQGARRQLPLGRAGVLESTPCHGRRVGRDPPTRAARRARRRRCHLSPAPCGYRVRPPAPAAA